MSEDDRETFGSWPPHDPTSAATPPVAQPPVAAPPSDLSSDAPPPSDAPSDAPPPPPPSTPPAPPSAPPPPDAATAWVPPPPTGFGSGPPAPMMAAVPPRWRSLRGLASALTILFVVNIAAGVFAIVAIAIRLGVIKDFENGNFTLDVLHRAQNSDDLVSAAAAIYGVVTLAIIVVFIIWMWRAAKNNEALGRILPRFGPGWSIGGWFIPFANFVIPILIMQDLWRGSDPSVTRGDPGWRGTRGSGLVGWWWAASLLGLVRLGGSDNANSNNSLSDIKRGNQVALFGFVVHIAAAILAIQVVRRLTARQEECLRTQQAAWNTANPAV